MYAYHYISTYSSNKSNIYIVCISLMYVCLIVYPYISAWLISSISYSGNKSNIYIYVYIPYVNMHGYISFNSYFDEDIERYSSIYLWICDNSIPLHGSFMYTYMYTLRIYFKVYFMYTLHGSFFKDMPWNISCCCSECFFEWRNANFLKCTCIN